MIVLTPIPTVSVNVNADTVPVSVLVSPRLSGSTKRGDYGDWLHWTERVRTFGLAVTFECQGQTLEVALPVEQLRPDLWDATFAEDTLVRPFVFPDPATTRVQSWPYRLGLSALKAVYMTTGIVHHNLEGFSRGDQQTPLQEVLAGFDVRWDPDHADAMRSRYGKTMRSITSAGSGLKGVPPTAMAPDGSVPVGLGGAGAGSIRSVITEPFSTFSHPPVDPPLAEDPTDFDTVLDFHQAITSLNAHRAVQRALGLVFDVELPASFVAPALFPFGTLSIIGATIGEGWNTPTTIPRQSVAYVHNLHSAGTRIFFPAPRVTAGEGLQAIAGMLVLSPTLFGLAQVDVDGGLMKAIALAETVIGQPFDRRVQPEDEEGFDDTSALATLRSSGLTLFADDRALQLLRTLDQSAKANTAATGNPPPDSDTRFFAEDLNRGYRLDIWENTSNQWRSLHARNAVYNFGNLRLPSDDNETIADEGFVQLAATTPSTKDGTQASEDLYLHEAIARWTGWSLSAPRPGKALSRYGDPEKAVPPDDLEDPDYVINPIVTPFDVNPVFTVASGTLPSLRFGRAYRMRARLVDLAGNGLPVDSPLAAFLSIFLGLPLRVEGLPYLRYQPTPSPVLIARTTNAVVLPGSAINRIVIRSFNDSVDNDGIAPDLTANDRHVAPPRATVDLGEQLGMFDDGAGKLNGSAAMYALIAERDKGDFAQSAPFTLAGEDGRTIPLEPADSVYALPYLPDVLARGAAFRNLPGSGEKTRGEVAPDGGAAAPVPYETLVDPNPRAGSATMVSYGGDTDWQEMVPFRFALEEGDTSPVWDGATRLLTAFLPKGTTKTVLLSSYMNPEDLKLMGVWQWIREGIEVGTIFLPGQQHLNPGTDTELVAHILQRAVEGGHWMICPPRVLKLVHAVQQPVGIPTFVPLTVRRADPSVGQPDPLLTMPELDPTAKEEMAVATSWRTLFGTDAFLLGGLRVHGASTAKVDIRAEWNDPVDNPLDPGPTETVNSKTIDEVPLPSTSATALSASGKDFRLVGQYDVAHDTIQFLRYGDELGNKKEGTTQFFDAAPRHQFGDTKHHFVNYTAVATSRFREYFDPAADLDFTRNSEPVPVHVPASARPLAPLVRYVIPTFGWQREASTNVKRSIRFGGGLRVYLDRPWYSSGADERLAVVTAPNGLNLTDDVREEWKALITQWGLDPIWKTAPLLQAPAPWNFPDAVNREFDLPLDERQAAVAGGGPGNVDVAAFKVDYDDARKMWYCDLTVDMPNPTYGAFIRLALARYQPYALKQAKLSRVVLADFAQLAPDRAAVVSADPYAPRTLRVTVSGVAPRGPAPTLEVEPQPLVVVHQPTKINVRVEKRRTDFGGNLGWEPALPTEATVTVDWHAPFPTQPDLTHWTGRVQFLVDPVPGNVRLVIEEHEYISANHTFDETVARKVLHEQPSRLIYAEVFELDHALIEGPEVSTGTEV